MSERKRKRRFFNFLDLGEEDLFEREPVEGGSGYSISVTYDKRGKPLVRVKTYGEVDAVELRKDIEQQYPGARIEGLEKQPLIRIVDEEKTKRGEGKPEEKKAKPTERKRRAH